MESAPVRRVGFAGLGVIGIEMARRILQAGFELEVWNRSADKAAPLVALGATLAATPAALARSVDVLCLCVTDAHAVEQVVFGDDGIATAGPASLRDLVVADHSTLHPAATRSIAARFHAAGGAWVDAPVTGGPSGAQQGALAVFAGGEPRHVERVRPVVMSFARQMTHLGPAGSGQAAKACNQMVSFGTAAVLAEALNLALKLGLDVARLPQAMEGGLADSAVLRRYAPAMVSGELTGSARTALKDLEIIIDLGRETGSPMPLTGLLASLHRMLASQGHFMGGMAGVIRLYAEGALTGAAVDPGDA
ncbi:2-hydroxy-3-oxopropionate reductase [Variovorax sp. SRS16]|uniref:NAD(P)-dependent oxidoreductase n=1 Tax=Variovorax sp. SRS16 TaxID=282217 RepID=UPI0013192117|nr:NAD(P)-dependent oxidoreductase [Variovorax sp. SRS16]VTU29805.1 2-hydroxy-3-oxopropionate reductase [Variovorax sp. SRS16]